MNHLPNAIMDERAHFGHASYSLGKTTWQFLQIFAVTSLRSSFSSFDLACNSVLLAAIINRK